MYPASNPIAERRVSRDEHALSFQYDPRDVDALTHLPNRRAMNDALEHALGDQRLVGNMAVVVVDLNDFKEGVNDLYGHDEGDKYLENAAGALKDSIRPEDVASVVTRYGGDEFVILLSGVRQESILEKIIARLHTNLDEIGVPNAIGGKVHEIGETGEELLKAADKRMYANKMKQRLENMSPEEAVAYMQIYKIALDAGLSLRGIAATVAALKAAQGTLD